LVILIIRSIIHCDLFHSSNNITVIKSRRIRWAGYIAYREGMRSMCKKPEWKNPMENLDVY
jgi:hypothetical protein